jgi:tripartite-type tricarboxylate transporter receptor subunit TctC
LALVWLQSREKTDKKRSCRGLRQRLARRIVAAVPAHVQCPGATTPGRHEMSTLTRALLAAAAAALAVSPAATAQSYPNKPVRIISTIPQGGSGDVAVRLAAAKASEAIGQQLLVETNGAGGGTVAAKMVMKAPPDGYTLFHSSNGALAASVFTKKDLGYDPLKDFVPITITAKSASFIAVNAGVPANTVKELVDYAKRHPGKLTYASNGIGSFFHITGETFKAAAGIDLLHIPYTGGKVSIPLNDLLAGRIDVFWPSLTLAGPHLKSGKLKLLATLGDRRLKRAPDVPTIAEAFPAYKPMPSWFALVGPAELPRPIVMRVHSEMAKALADPTVSGRLEELGMQPGGDSPPQTRETIGYTIDFIGKAVKALGIKPQ